MNTSQKPDGPHRAVAGHPVARLERARCAALVAGDWPRLTALLAPGLVYVHSTGTVHDRDGLLQFLREELQLSVVERRGVEVHAQGGFAWCRGLLRIAGRLRASDTQIDAVSYLTQVWCRSEENLVKDGGDGENWQLMQLQSTTVSPALWKAAAGGPGV